MSTNSTIPTAPQRKKAFVRSAGAAAGMMAVVGLGGCASLGGPQGAAGVDLALIAESTLHEFSFPVRNAFDGPRAIADVPQPDPMAATPSAAVFDQRLAPYRLTKEEAMALSPLPVTSTDDIDPRPPHDEALATDDLAALLAGALREVDAAEVNDTVDLFGYTVAVYVAADGLAGVPLLVTWSLSGADVSPGWSASHLGARFQPATDDGGSVDIWIPNLSSPGDYSIEVEIIRASDGSPIASGDLLVPAPDPPQE
ncbi:hypothetical protein [Microbacterium sp. zg-YB36]|uniref:hypothetical protein n=1 Tax=Microbacterium sp. zg-YB36 TaxID=2969407 RepID=UPI00214D0F51|nr:hypothetical protein [Microbacterium sp. zg-YB36]MDL5350910.1 hypothetical protein [Microbacterium sp. zg-YB36]